MDEVQRLIPLLQPPSVIDGRNDMYDRTALIVGAFEGHVEVVEALLRHGAAPNRRVNSGLTAAAIAAQGGHAAVVCALAAAKADWDVPYQEGWTHLLQEASFGHRTEVIVELLRAGAALELKHTTHQETALRWAAYKNHHVPVALLLRAGADPWVTDNEGRTPHRVPLHARYWTR